MVDIDGWSVDAGSQALGLTQVARRWRLAVEGRMPDHVWAQWHNTAMEDANHTSTRSRHSKKQVVGTQDSCETKSKVVVTDAPGLSHGCCASLWGLGKATRC